MVKLAKPNKKKLLENVERQLLRYERRPLDVSYDSLARTYMYLKEFSKYCDAMEKALEMQEGQINLAKEKNGPYSIASEIHTKANFLRLLFREEESRRVFKEALRLYKQALPEDYRNDPDTYRNVIVQISTVEFHLGNYQNSIDICETYKGEKPIAEMISRAILDGNNPEILEKTMDIIKKENRGIPMGMENGNTTSLWDFYEICLQLLGLPSILDEIKAYIESRQ